MVPAGLQTLKARWTRSSMSPPGPRRPKCSRCRHHGIVVPQKGHLKTCPFLGCLCWKCRLVSQRTRIATLQRHLKKAQNEPPDPASGSGTSGQDPPTAGTPCASAPEEGARCGALPGPPGSWTSSCKGTFSCFSFGYSKLQPY
uniref:DM domain-containing protein n=1 Tax=Echeneis naucrates TaxID=173247 RepID=A0A665TN20_ECHNA